MNKGYESKRPKKSKMSEIIEFFCDIYVVCMGMHYAHMCTIVNYSIDMCISGFGL